MPIVQIGRISDQVKIYRIYAEQIAHMVDLATLTTKPQKLLALCYVGLGLGEVGEIQNKLKKVIRDSDGIVSDSAKAELGKEIGDVLWYLSQLCTELRLDMGKIAEQNIEKLQSRKERGMICGSGDSR